MFHRPKAEDETPDQQPSQKQGSEMVQNTEQKQDQSNPNADRSIGIPGSGLSRMGQSGPKIPGSYQGYGAYNPAQQPASGTAQQSESGRRLIVGRGISMSGEIESCDHLVVEGKVEAALKGAKLLEITDSGTFFGTVEIDEATVAGSFEGDLTVTGRLTVKSGGSITGAVSYGELSVEGGAVIDGKLSPLKSAEEMPRKGSSKSAKREEAQQNPDTQAQPQGAQQMEQGGELPFADQRSVAAE